MQFYPEPHPLVDKKWIYEIRSIAAPYNTGKYLDSKNKILHVRACELSNEPCDLIVCRDRSCNNQQSLKIMEEKIQSDDEWQHIPHSFMVRSLQWMDHPLSFLLLSLAAIGIGIGFSFLFRLVVNAIVIAFNRLDILESDYAYYTSPFSILIIGLGTILFLIPFWIGFRFTRVELATTFIAPLPMIGFCTSIEYIGWKMQWWFFFPSTMTDIEVLWISFLMSWTFYIIFYFLSTFMLIGLRYGRRGMLFSILLLFAYVGCGWMVDIIGGMTTYVVTFIVWLFGAIIFYSFLLLTLSKFKKYSYADTFSTLPIWKSSSFY